MKKVFAVDDSASIRLYMDKVLGQMGYSIELAEDGDIALERIRDHMEPIDIFIIDIVMKGMDGFTLIKHIRNLDRFKSTPIIVLTNLEDFSNVESAKSSGANCWITKPFDARQISEAIENLVK